MIRFAYVHGFNSGARSRSGRQLSELVGAEVICPEYDYSRPFEHCLRSIGEQVLDRLGAGDELRVMGTSLGGYYALQLRHPAITHVFAWNPVVFPALQLQQFLGRNVNFQTGEEWTFTKDVCLSYAAAPDSRSLAEGSVVERHIWLADADELLDGELAQAFWRGHARIHGFSSGHRVADYAPMRGEILAGRSRPMPAGLPTSIPARDRDAGRS